MDSCNIIGAFMKGADWQTSFVYLPVEKMNHLNEPS